MKINLYICFVLVPFLLNYEIRRAVKSHVVSIMNVHLMCWCHYHSHVGC